MALILFRVFVLGVIAAVADGLSVPVTWSGSQRVYLPCAAPGAERLPARGPPPQLEPEDKSRPKSYVWWRNGKEITPKRVSPNGTLEVSRRGSGDGVYQCATPLHFGTVLGYPLHLKFAYMEKQFSVHPANGTASIGQPYIISCDINSAPPASVSWLRDAKLLPDDDRYYFFDNQLLITEVRREDQGLYRCIATNPHVNKSRTSHGGRLQVEELSKEIKTSLLPLKQNPNLIVPRGDRVVLACPVSGWPRPRLIWEVTPPGGRVAELEVTDQVHVLTRLDFDLEGLYTCRVESHSELIKTFNVTIREPVVINIPPLSKEVLRASTVRFNCSAKGRPKPKVTWFKNGKPLILDGRFKLLSSPSAKDRLELVISSITSEDAGVYQCFASSDASVASAWAVLNVTGTGAEPPAAVRCQPVGAKSVRVEWLGPAGVFAYTVHTKIQAKPGLLLTGQPHNKTEEIVNIEKPLTPYRFHVRAYKKATVNIKNVASDFSEGVICQGQGVPIKLVTLDDDDKVLVSWKEFSDRTPGVVQWILQYKVQNTTHEHNITLDGNVYNYTFNVSSTRPLQIRLLGSKSLEWLHQNLTLIPWSSTTDAGRDLDSGEVNAVVEDVELELVGLREVRVRWRCCEGDFDPQRHSFYVCVKKIDGLENCQDSYTNSATIEGLQPNSEYDLQVQVRIPGREPGGPFSPPLRFTTQPEGPLRFKDLKYKFVNSSTLRVSWNGGPARYTVHYSAQLKLPVEQWASIETMGNTVLITGLQPTEGTFVMLTGYDPHEHSRIITVPPQVTDLDVHYGYTNTGVKVSWARVGPHNVRYAQNITRPLEEWPSVNVTDSHLQLTGLDPSLTTYVMVTAPGSGLKSQVLTIPPRPSDNLSFYLSVGIGSGVCILCVLLAAAFCIWRRRKRSRSPVRSRRRTQSANEANEEEGSEMKSVGGRLANGGGKEAGEPLLNGHVHITENPTPKTPNGKMKKGRLHEAAFDVSRYDDQDATLETVLDPDTPASTTYNLLDTSRRPEYDLSRPSRDVSTNNSFTKLPDDNMNSEITRSTHFERDNSKIEPTLQPNG